MDNNLTVAIVALLTAAMSLIASKIGASKEMKKDIKDIKQSMELRKEENSILIDGTEASLKAHIENGANGECHTALFRIEKYKKNCLQHRT
jgi:hypothetical protein